MDIKDLKTDLLACNYVAEGKWLIADPVTAPTSLLLGVSMFIPGPLLINARLVKYIGNDRYLLALFTKDDQFLCSWRANSEATETTKPSMQLSKFMVRLMAGTPSVEVPDTIAELDETNGS